MLIFDTARLIDAVADFLRKEKVQNLVDAGNWKAVYDEAAESLMYLSGVGVLTDIVYRSGLDPLKDLKEIPNAFLSANDVEEFTIPDHIEEIGDFAFASCIMLKNIVLPDNVKKIGYNTFFNCFGLEEITVPSSLEEIGLNAFAGCHRLKKITYKGSMAEWSKLMDATWVWGTTFRVYCTDGTLKHKDNKWVRVR